MGRRSGMIVGYRYPGPPSFGLITINDPAAAPLNSGHHLFTRKAPMQVRILTGRGLMASSPADTARGQRDNAGMTGVPKTRPDTARDPVCGMDVDPRKTPHHA